MSFAFRHNIAEWTPAIIGSLLSTCAKQRLFNIGRSIHATIIKQDYWWTRDIYTQNHLLNLYAKCGKLHSAQHMFDKMPLRNTITWTALITGYNQHGYNQKALETFSCMVSEIFSSLPNEFTYVSVVSSCTKLEQPLQGMQIHSHAFQRGYLSSVMVSNVFISLYMACGMILEAEMVFEEVLVPDQVSWNSLVSGYSQNGLSEAALETFLKMRRYGERVTSFSLATAITACLEEKRVGKGLHAVSVKAGLDVESFTGCTLIQMYAKYRRVEDAVRVFEKLGFKDIASWNSMVEGCAECDQGERGLQVFSEFLKSEMKPDEITITAVLGICASLATLEYSKLVHCLCVKNGLDRRIRVQNSMIDVYSKCGSLDDGAKIFGCMEEKTIISWTAMMGGLAHHGRAMDVIHLFEEMKKEGFDPNKITYTCVLSACGHGGLVDIGQSVFDSMEIEPETDQLVCMVHLLAGGGRFEEARDFIDKFSPEHKELLRDAFLVACKNMGEWERGLGVAEEIMKDGLPTGSRSLVLLSAVFSASGRWVEAENLRNEMKARKMKKEPGCSWIEVDNRVEVFGMNTEQE